MKLLMLATAVAALAIGTSAAAVTVQIDYSLSVSDMGQTANIGSMILDYDGSSYTLESLVLSVPKKTTAVTSDVTLAPYSGSDYCIYSLSSCGIVPEKDSVYFIFDPSLTSQTTTFYVYSVNDAATESLPLTIQAVPEAATWAMMLLGFGAIGITLRHWKPRQVVQVT